MLHNDEKDRYRNNALVANYKREVSDKLNFSSNLRFSDTYLQYDKEVDTATATHNEEEDSIQSSVNFSLTHKTSEKFQNKLTYANTYIKRIYGAAPGSGNTIKDNYYGDRHAFTYTGNYNFNLDNSIIFGLEREDDQIGYNKDLTGLSYKSFYTTSSYYDFQSRLTNNLYATFGSRFDNNSIAENEDAHRGSLALSLIHI